MKSILKRHECEYLEKNFLICLHEKTVKDDVPKRMCNIPWFLLECPTEAKSYLDIQKLSQKFNQKRQFLNSYSEQEEIDEDEFDDDEDQFIQIKLIITNL